VLLKAGMTIKQAMICNLISSLLCLLGVLIGLAIGSAHNTAPWIFASTAGMFLYIALVDMVIAKSRNYEKTKNLY
jgi:zinc transporter ZupT